MVIKVPVWVKRRKHRVCRACGGPPLDDVFRKRATFWCSACERLWTLTRRADGSIKVRYFDEEGKR